MDQDPASYDPSWQPSTRVTNAMFVEQTKPLHVNFRPDSADHDTMPADKGQKPYAKAH